MLAYKVNGKQVPLHIIAPAVYHSYLQQLLSALNQTSPFITHRVTQGQKKYSGNAKTSRDFPFFPFLAGHI